MGHRKESIGVFLSFLMARRDNVVAVVAREAGITVGYRVVYTLVTVVSGGLVCMFNGGIRLSPMDMVRTSY